MTSPVEDPTTIIEARAVHKASNALKLTFHMGSEEILATGVQGAGGGRGKKLGVLFGFKNGGTGNHRLTFAYGTVLNIASKDSAPSLFTKEDGSAVATAERGATTTVTLADHSTLFTLADDPEEAKTLELFRLVVSEPGGAPIGRLDVVRREGGWTLSRAMDALATETIWWDRAGRALPIPILGTRVSPQRPLTETERNVLLCVCVDIAIGLRPYATCMQ